MFVVHFMRPSECAGITVIDVAKYLKALMDKNVMNNKIGKSIAEYSCSNGNTNFEYVKTPQQKKSDTDHRIYYKEKIVSLKPRIVIFSMVILVPTPQKTVHNIFMADPRDRFHYKKCKYKNKYMDPQLHHIKLSLQSK